MEWRMAATLSERAASLDWQIDRTRATAMNESVYTGEYVFNTNVYGYVLSSATTIIYKQRVKVLSAVECLSLPPPPPSSLPRACTHAHWRENTLSIPRTVPGPFGMGKNGGRKKEADCFVPFIAEKNATVAVFNSD